MHSAGAGKFECIMAITKAGADLNVQDSQGRTAGNLHFFVLHVEKRIFTEPTKLQNMAK